MSAPQKTMAELAAEYGLAPNEYQVILDRLGREPNNVELGVFSVMWSGTAPTSPRRSTSASSRPRGRG